MVNVPMGKRLRIMVEVLAWPLIAAVGLMNLMYWRKPTIYIVAYCIAGGSLALFLAYRIWSRHRRQAQT
jgi:hypothetical protein